MTDYNDGKWHGWNGGECPVHPKSMIEYVWVSSYGDTGVKTRIAGFDDYQIIPAWTTGQLKAFRVVKAYREQREWWAVDQDFGKSSRRHIGLFLSEERASACAKEYKSRGANVEIIHVREVIE